MRVLKRRIDCDSDIPLYPEWGYPIKPSDYHRGWWTNQNGQIFYLADEETSSWHYFRTRVISSTPSRVPDMNDDEYEVIPWVDMTPELMQRFFTSEEIKALNSLYMEILL